MVAGWAGTLQDDQKRRAFEHRAIRIALRRGIPIADACHDMQVVNSSHSNRSFDLGAGLKVNVM